MEELVAIIVPIAICVVLPVLISWIKYRHDTNKDNKNAEIILKAIENNSCIDADSLVEALGKKRKTPLEVLQQRLLRGCIFTLIGIAAAIYSVIDACTTAYFDINDQPAFIVAGVCLAIGIAYLVVYFVTRKSIGDGDKRPE
ncbi:MAG: hypothetical protein K2J38_05390 [Muribaculaceae bacterium]|nr:hypothetical protein [Muribaculaceae bacterium]